MPFKSTYIIAILFFCYTSFCAAQNSYYTDYEEGKLDSLFYYYNNGQSKKAYKKAHPLLRKLKTNRAKANLNILLTLYHNKYASVDSSNYYANQLLNHKIPSDDTLNVWFTIKSYELLALNSGKQGLLLEKMKWHLKAIALSEKHNEEEQYYRNLSGLGTTYIDLNRPEDALDVFKKCLKYTKDPEITLGSYINLGSIYSSLLNYDLSNSYLQKAEKICIATNNLNALAYVLYNTGDNYLYNGNTSKALGKYYEAKRISNENKFTISELNLGIKIGEVLYDENKDKDAILIFSETLVKAIDLGVLGKQMQCYKMLDKLSERNKNYKDAYIFRKKHYNIKDSIANLQKEKEFKRLEIGFKTLEKEKAIKLLEIENLNKSLKIKNKDATIERYKLQKTIIAKQNENQVLQLQSGVEKRKNEIALLKEKEELKAVELDRQNTIQYIVLIAFIILLVPTIGLLIIYYQKLQTQELLHLKEKEINAQRVSALKKDQELKLIKASIKGQNRERRKIAQEMHDSIGGNLAAIKLQFSQLSSHPNKLKLIYSQLDDTYEQVRNLSHNLLPKKIRETDFVLLIKEYIKTVEDASKITVNTTFFSEKELNSLSKILQNELFAIFQELTTNTIKHAKANTIDLQIDLLNECIFFVYEDNGKGFDLSKTTLGIGLTNIKNRVENYKGILHINSKPNWGISINIEIPLKNEQNEA